MLTKSQIKFVRSLSLNKYRKQDKCFVAEGDKVVSEFINSNFNIKHIFCSEEWWTQNNAHLTATEIVIDKPENLKKLSNLQSPPAVIAVIEMPEPVENDIEKGLVLALDEVQDPGNVGTIIRIADWFGISYILAGAGTADAYNPKVVQATMGSLARVKVLPVELEQQLQQLEQNNPVCGAVLEGENIYNAQLPESAVILIGNEGNGINQSLLPLIDLKLAIPAFGKAESLNAAVATGIICSEFRRRSS